MKVTKWIKRKNYPVGDGWQKIVNKCLKEIAKVDSTIEITTIKEKFGTLRIYCMPFPDTIDDFIEKAEQESAKTCEACGKKGKLREGGWILTLCDSCYKKRK